MGVCWGITGGAMGLCPWCASGDPKNIGSTAGTQLPYGASPPDRAEPPNGAVSSIEAVKLGMRFSEYLFMFGF